MSLAIRRVASRPPLPDDAAGAAVRYAQAGLWVVPLCWPAADGTCGCGRGHVGRAVGKAPLFPGWRDMRLTPGGVRRAWKGNPQANVGVLLHASNLLLLDLDGAEGIAEAVGLGLPEGPTDQADRPRGELGLHVFLRRGDLPQRSVVGRGSSGHIDLKSEGLAVLPPSRRFVDGQIVTREWWAGMSLLDMRPGTAPGWVADLLTGEPGGGTWDVARSAPGSGARRSLATSCVRTTQPQPRHLPVETQALLDLGPARFPGRYPSRSEALFSVICAMIRSDWLDTQITSACLAQPWISGMRDRHGDMANHVARQAIKARRLVDGENVGW